MIIRDALGLLKAEAVQFDCIDFTAHQAVLKVHDDDLRAALRILSGAPGVHPWIRGRVLVVDVERT